MDSLDHWYHLYQYQIVMIKLECLWFASMACRFLPVVVDFWQTCRSGSWSECTSRSHHRQLGSAEIPGKKRRTWRSQWIQKRRFLTFGHHMTSWVFSGLQHFKRVFVAVVEKKWPFQGYIHLYTAQFSWYITRFPLNCDVWRKSTVFPKKQY